MFRMVFTYVLSGLSGRELRETSGVDPYELLHNTVAEQSVRENLPERSKVTFIHIETGDRIVSTVDWFAPDEAGFSCPMVTNEKALDAFIEAHKGPQAGRATPGPS